MRSLSALALVCVAVAVAAGCGGIVSNPEGTAGPGADGGMDAPSGSTDAAPFPFTDASDLPAAAEIAAACAPGTPARPESFRGFDWNREHPGCGGRSTCLVTFELAEDCSVHGVADGSRYLLGPLDPGDCLALKTWVTSARLLDALRDETICSGGEAKGNPEAMATTLDDGAVNRKIDPVCDAGPFGQNRDCLQAVLSAYMPGPRIKP